MTLASPKLHEKMTKPARRRNDDQKRLQHIRIRHEDAEELTFVFSGGPTLEWWDRAADERRIMATFELDVPAQQVEILSRYKDDVGFLLQLLTEAFTTIRQLRSGSTTEAPKDYAAQAAMLCGQPAYIRYLQEKHALPADATADQVADAQRKAAKINSKADLNAAARWIRHHQAYQAWLNQPDAR